MLHYADDPPGHASFQLHHELVLVSQPCLAAQCRPMSKARMSIGGQGRMSIDVWVGMGGRRKSSLGRRWKMNVG
ncbi:hypothetical protein F2Q69_00013121 [Brassica cretica]|uniref:Uncharacterized protein n=1 Tax=Brassica cretica TaxID=69181 RepID=A0A8S9QQN1_BRACR|nr:hypothetical protein F2Q69_00013121 [Brassica cretica]